MTDRIEGSCKSLSLLSTLDVLASLALVLFVAANIWLVISTSPIIWVDQFQDDAYYYLGIARSVAEHGLFQFLPPFETNGFQPLWQMMLAVAAFVAGTSTQSMVLECYALSVFFIALFLLLARGINGSALAGVLAILAFPSVMLQGMETVVLPGFALLFFAARGWRIRGLLGALIFLGRLDAISLVVARDVYYVLRKRDVDFRHYLVIMPVVIAYVAFNFVRFGLILPVSGLSKSLHMIPLENMKYAFQYFATTIPALVILAIALVLKTLSGSRPIQFKHGPELIICAMSTIVCALYYGALSGWPLWPWYFWAPMLITYYALLEIIDIVRIDIANWHLVRLGGSSIAVAVCIFLAGGSGYVMVTLRLIREAYFHLPITETYGRKNVELVDWVATKGLPPGTMFAMGDRAGSFGYFLGRDYRFLHAEGLVADSAYYAALKKDEGLAFVERQPINYWVADREQYLQSGSIIGVPEPVQGMSMHKGGYLICFNKIAIILDQSYHNNVRPATEPFEQRYLFDMNGRVNCPGPLQAQFETLRSGYGQVRAYSLPVEEATRGWINPQVKRYLGF